MIPDKIFSHSPFTPGYGHKDGDGYGDGLGTFGGDYIHNDYPYGDGNHGDGAGGGTGEGEAQVIFIACTDTFDLQAVLINTLVRAC